MTGKCTREQRKQSKGKIACMKGDPRPHPSIKKLISREKFIQKFRGRAHNIFSKQ